jgi:hypothetical protein
VVDLNQEKVRKAILVFLVLTVVNLSIVSVAMYKGVEFMDSTTFCGEACHSVMAPEFATYQRSPHSRVHCVDCHIGPGADWFVKSKLSGAWQVVSTTFDLYPRPIPTPVENLRPARDTCEQCHWPTKFHGDRLDVKTRFDEDEANTELKTVLLLRVGGVSGRESSGIHWHVDPNIRIRYRSNESRSEIYDVELTSEDGTTLLYRPSEMPEDAEPGEWREMDCVDCHNRPTHIYRMPGSAIDEALETGRIPRDLPFIKREGMRVIQETFESHEDARERIPEMLREYYSENHPGLFEARADDVRAAADALSGLYSVNVHPSMNIEWGTYPNHIGHEEAPGCFRCHNDEHATEDGEVISQDCDTCHTLLALEEENPSILDELNP